MNSFADPADPARPFGSPPVLLRPPEGDDDYARMAEIVTLVLNDVYRGEDLRRLLDNCAPESHALVRVAEAEGELLGYTSVSHHPWNPPGVFAARVYVHPEARGRGVGGALACTALDFARRHGGRVVRTLARDDDARSLDFARRFGCEVTFQTFFSRLDLTRFDETPFAWSVRAAEARGLRFSSLAREGRDEARRRRLYELNRVTALDVPDSDGVFMTFEAFERHVFEASWFDADAQILALHGEEYVGLGALGVNADTNVGLNAFTGVRAAYRGAGLALALKLLVIREARRRGVSVIRTGNNSLNAPMLAVNRKLGYVPEPGFFTLETHLGDRG